MATILGTNTLDIIIIGLQAGQLTDTTLFYYPVTGADIEPGADLAAQWLVENQAALLACMIDNWTFLELRWVKRIAGIDTNGFIPLNLQGTVIGDALPAFTAQVLIKTPDNADRDPPAAAPFRTGRSSYPGIPEAAQNDGVLTAAQITLLNTYGLSAITLSGTLTDYKLFYPRREGIPSTTTAAVPVSSYVASKVGTQNTRKR